jgi:hypothetical protein
VCLERRWLNLDAILQTFKCLVLERHCCTRRQRVTVSIAACSPSVVALPQVDFTSNLNYWNVLIPWARRFRAVVTSTSAETSSTLYGILLDCCRGSLMCQRITRLLGNPKSLAENSKVGHACGGTTGPPTELSVQGTDNSVGGPFRWNFTCC